MKTTTDKPKKKISKWIFLTTAVSFLFVATISCNSESPNRNFPVAENSSSETISSSEEISSSAETSEEEESCSIETPEETEESCSIETSEKAEPETTEESTTATPTTQVPPTAAPTQAPTQPPTTAPTQTPTAAPTQAPTVAPTQSPVAVTYVLNTNTKKFHKPSCRYVDDIKPKNRQDYTGGRGSIIDMGYVPCKVCNP